MSFGITWPANTTDIINRIRDVIGRLVTFYVTVTGTPCTTCTLDPVTNLATDPFCVECSGKYWKDTLSGWPCSGHVRWRNADKPLWSPGGIIDEGDCKVTIAYSGMALYNVQHSEYVEVDGFMMYVKDFKLRGVQPVNRITVTLLEDKG